MTSTSNMLSTEIDAARRMLLGNEYDPASMVQSLKDFSRTFHRYPHLLNDLTLCAMALGHIEVAQRLVDEGVDPMAGRKSVHLFNLFRGMGNMADMAGLSVPHLMAGIDPHLMVSHRYAGKRHTRTQVLAQVLQQPQTWAIDINGMWGGMTALVRSQAVDKHPGSLRHFPTGALPVALDMRELDDFQSALIQAGADINHGNTGWNFLAASIPMAPPGGEQEDVDISPIDRALAMGVDPVRSASAAWAQAITQDAPLGYAKNQGLGIRAQALMDRGIGLVAQETSPIGFSPVYSAFSLGAGWAVNALAGQEGAIGGWRETGTGASILHRIPSMNKAAGRLLKQVPDAELVKAINSIDSSGHTPLHEAVAVLDPALVETYLSLGADPNVKNTEGVSIIEGMRAKSPKLRSNFERVFTLLHEGGAVFDIPDDPTSTPLHKAALMLSVSVCRALIGKGLDPNALDKAGKTPLEAALFGHQQSSDSFFNEERGQAQVEVMDFFSQQGVDLMGRGAHGRTLLHEAMGRGNHRVAIALLERGADPHAEDDMGLTPMHMWDIQQHLRQQAQVMPVVNDVDVPGCSLSKINIKPAHHRHVRELIEAFAQAGADIRSQRFGMAAFGSVVKIPAIASVIDAIEMQANTPMVAETGCKRPRL